MPEIESLPARILSVQEKVKINLPLIIEKTKAAEDAMRARYESIAETVQQYDGSDTEEIQQISDSLNKLLVAVKESYDVNSVRRKEITGPLDEFKAEVMEYEKKVQYDGKVDNYYTKLRKLLTSIEQKRQDKRLKDIEEAKKQKATEDYKVDCGVKVKQALASLLINRVKQVDDGCREFFAATTLDKWEERVTAFNTMKAKLKQEHYDECFKLPVPPIGIDWPPSNNIHFVKELMAEEPYEKWNKLTNEKIIPVLNDWRSRIPSIKEEKIKIANAAEDDKKRLLEEQRIRDEQDKQRTEQQAKQAQEEQNKSIEADAEMSKMQNAFVVQAVSQELGDEGAKAKVLKFTDPKLVAKALAQMMYHVMIHKDFPGIQKRDKSKNPITDDQGRPVYIDCVQGWIDFFLKLKVDADIEGTKIFEDAKITVRK